MGGTKEGEGTVEVRGTKEGGGTGEVGETKEGEGQRKGEEQ